MSLIDKHYELLQMLTYKRPAGSTTEEKFIERFIDSRGAMVDEYGNRIIEVLHDNGESATTMFTAHTDTVHRSEGIGAIVVDAVSGIVTTGEDNEVLGADDATGCYLMLKMLEAGVPGMYVFFREEEVGGRGSSFFVEHGEYANITKCISFDRNSKTADVITHQGWGRCCSDTFAEALASKLKALSSLDYKPSDNGIFTDSANFTEEVPECTNLSVGYYCEHTANELQCIQWVDKMLNALVKIDWEALPVARDPSEVDNDWFSSYSFGFSSEDNDIKCIEEVMSDWNFRLEDLDEFAQEFGQKDLKKAVLQGISTRLKTRGLKAREFKAWWETKMGYQ